MSLDDFIKRFADEFEDMEDGAIGADTVFTELEDWNSLSTLGVIAMVKMEFNLDITADEIRACDTVKELFDFKHRCINFYINKFQIPSPTLRGVAKRPLILADMTFLTRLRSSEIPPLIVLAA